MMRKLTVFLSLFLIFLLAGPHVWAKPVGRSMLDQQVERQVMQAQQTAKKSRPAAKPRAGNLTPRQQQIKQALDNVRLKLDDPNLQDHVTSFEQFEMKSQWANNYFTEQLRKWQALQEELTPLFAQEGDNLVAAQVGITKEGRPDYGKETKGIPFIYLTDASGHGTQSIVNEVQEVMKQVRTANPKARILLALEFAVMLDFTTPIQFAGKTNQYMQTVAPYDKLIPQANQLGMDILALDDAILWPWEEGTGYKIGNQLLYIPISYEQITEKQWQEIFGFVSMSTLGMKLRNEQWVSYLQAVKPFYDIVIVYAGSGHLNSPNTPALDVPIQLAEKHIVFDFYTLESNQEEDDFVDNTYKMLCDANACVIVPQTEENTENAIDWDGKSIIYQKIDHRAFKKYVSSLPVEKQQQLSAIIDKALSAGFTNVEPEVEFMVYLPDVTQPAGK